MGNILGYFDGAAEPTNPGGIATYGWAIVEDDKLLGEGKGVCGTPFTRSSTNNVGEYNGVMNLLQNAASMGIADILILGDSQLAIRQLSGEYAVNAPHLITLYMECKRLEKSFSKVRYKWVPREQNSHADRLSHEAYVEYIEANRETVIPRILPQLATEKQKEFLRKLKIQHDPFIGKREASRLIDRKLNTSKRR
ncbi:MAG: ribonuclease HI [Thermoplasmataceae archaeon]